MELNHQLSCFDSGLTKAIGEYAYSQFPLNSNRLYLVVAVDQFMRVTVCCEPLPNQNSRVILLSKKSHLTLNFTNNQNLKRTGSNSRRVL